jgi:hypothetical protein
VEFLTQAAMRRLTRSLPTKADKIRTLGRAGVNPADIGRFLGIRYQQAYNVLKRSGISPSAGGVRDAERATASAPARAVLDETGRILLPARILESWSAVPGEELLVRLEGDELRVLTRSAGLRLAREVLRKYPRGDKSMADELIAERRRDAERDDG